MNIKALFSFWLIMSLFTLAACSNLTTTSGPSQPLAANNAIHHWQLRGKIGLRNGQQADSAYINWNQCEDAFQIKISGPLGQGAAHLHGDQHSVTLENSDQQFFHAADAEQLLQQQFGWSFPVSQLFYWLRAIPSPDSSYRPNASDQSFRQSGWQIHYPAFTTVDGYQLPSKIIAQQPPLKVTLIIKQWQLQPCEQQP